MGSTRTTLEWFFTGYKRCSYQACSNYEMEWKQSHCQTCRKKLSDRCEFNSESYGTDREKIRTAGGIRKVVCKNISYSNENNGMINMLQQPNAHHFLALPSFHL